MLVNQQHFRTIWPKFDDGKAMVQVIDQTRLPHVFAVADIASLQDMVHAIKTMQVRGAPLIGAAAAYGIALAMEESCTDVQLSHAAITLVAARPTAVNLKWAVDRMLARLQPLPLQDRPRAAWAEAAVICDEDVLLNQAIGQHGLEIICQQVRSKTRTLNILTHCNAGWLATVDFGTALAPIYAAHDAGINLHVWVGETRPRNQGASLTAWELGQHGVPHTVISDNAGGHLMLQGQVDMVIVGADRVTATGDVCNKIGTYLKALAAYHGDVTGARIPFYAAVPSPTIDWTIEEGVAHIEIEERHADELIWISGKLADGTIASVNVLPSDTQVVNPAFDVTPAKFVTGIITEHGVFAPDQLREMLECREDA